MRIAHVVTYASADGAFGGPTRVAFAQAKALAELGHEVTIFAGSPPDEAGEIEHDGFRLRTFPVQKIAPFGGFATLRPRGLRAAVRAHASDLDVAHVHLARDLTTLPAALTFKKAGVPYVTQTHGMIDGSDKRLASLLDYLATRRALAGAASWLLLTPKEKLDLAEVATPGRVLAIRNGVELREVTPLSERSDTVLFLARLHERKRPLAFVEMAQRLADGLPDTRFLLVGPDEGEGAAVERAIAASGLGDRLQWIGALPPDDTASVMASARVYVLPAVNEVFPMTVLESFVAGTPVVTTSSLGIAPDCERFGAAVITDGTVDALADAVLRVRTDDDVSESLRRGATAYLKEELDIRGVARELQEEYAYVMRRHYD